MKTSTMLKRAEKFLWDGLDADSDDDTTLCWALERAVDKKRSEGIRALIHRRLGKCITYSEWAERKGFLPNNWGRDWRKWYPIIQANRLRWMRKLQREFRAKGD